MSGPVAIGVHSDGAGHGADVFAAGLAGQVVLFGNSSGVFGGAMGDWQGGRASDDSVIVTDDNAASRSSNAAG